MSKQAKMKVCMISPSFPNMHCGIGDYTAQLVNFLIDSDLEIGVITSVSKKIKLFIKSWSPSKVSVFPIIKRWGLLDIITIYRKICKFNPKIVHIQYQWWLYRGKAAIILLPLFLKIFRRKLFVVTTFHDLVGPYLFPKARPLRKLAIKILALFSDRVIASNKKDIENLNCLIPNFPEKISYIPVGAGLFLDENREIDISTVRKQIRDDEKQILISNFGYILPHKGIEDLLQAVKILIEKKYPIKLLVIGGANIDIKIRSSYYSELRKKADALKIAPYVTWFGHCSCEAAASYLIASDMCVLPYADGVSGRRTSFVTPLSLGLPIVTTQFDNVPDELIDRHNVLLVEPNSPDQLVGAVEELINSSELRNKLREAAKKLYKEVYSWDKIAADTRKIYEEELDNKCR